MAQPAKHYCSDFWSVFKHVLLVISLVAYAFLGAWLFSLLEQSADYQRRVDKNERLDRLKHEVLRRLEEEIFLRNIPLPQGERLRRNREAQWVLDSYEARLGVRERTNETNWDTFGSMFFACSVFTTIGYGTYAPITTPGRAATVVYGIIGIPLFVVVLLDLGKLFFRLYRATVNCCCRRRLEKQKRQRWVNASTLNPRVKHEVDPADLPLAVAVILLLAWTFLCAAVLCLWEHNWDYFTSVYFSFVSLWTVGLGDIVPSRHNYTLVVYLFVLVGLSFVAMFAYLMQSKIQALINSLVRQINSEFQRAQEEGLQEKMTAIGNPKDGVNDLIYRQPRGARILSVFLNDYEQMFIEKHWRTKARLRSRGVQTGTIEIQGGEILFRPSKVVQFRTEKGYPDADGGSIGSFVTAAAFWPGANFADEEVVKLNFSSPGSRPKSPPTLAPITFNRKALSSGGTSGASSPLLAAYNFPTSATPPPEQPPSYYSQAVQMEPRAEFRNTSPKSSSPGVISSEEDGEPYQPVLRGKQSTDSSQNQPFGGERTGSFRIFQQSPKIGRNMLDDREFKDKLNQQDRSNSVSSTVRHQDASMKLPSSTVEGSNSSPNTYSTLPSRRDSSRQDPSFRGATNTFAQEPSSNKSDLSMLQRSQRPSVGGRLSQSQASPLMMDDDRFLGNNDNFSNNQPGIRKTSGMRTENGYPAETFNGSTARSLSQTDQDPNRKPLKPRNMGLIAQTRGYRNTSPSKGRTEFFQEDARTGRGTPISDYLLPEVLVEKKDFTPQP